MPGKDGGKKKGKGAGRSTWVYGKGKLQGPWRERSEIQSDDTDEESWPPVDDPWAQSQGQPQVPGAGGSLQVPTQEVVAVAGSSDTASAALTVAAQYSSSSLEVTSQSVVAAASSDGMLRVTAPTTSWHVRSQECGIICPVCGPSEWCRKHESHVDACVCPQGIDHFPQRAVSGRWLSSSCLLYTSPSPRD